MSCVFNPLEGGDFECDDLGLGLSMGELEESELELVESEGVALLEDAEMCEYIDACSVERVLGGVCHERYRAYDALRLKIECLLRGGGCVDMESFWRDLILRCERGIGGWVNAGHYWFANEVCSVLYVLCVERGIGVCIEDVLGISVSITRGRLMTCVKRRMRVE